jgi:hypothetical protein
MSFLETPLEVMRAELSVPQIHQWWKAFMPALTMLLYNQPASVKPEVMELSGPAPLTSEISVSQLSWLVRWL